MSILTKIFNQGTIDNATPMIQAQAPGITKLYFPGNGVAGTGVVVGSTIIARFAPGDFAALKDAAVDITEKITVQGTQNGTSLTNVTWQISPA